IVSGKIVNLEIVDFKIKNISSYTGVLAGRMYGGHIEDVHARAFNGAVIEGTSYVSGLIAWVRGTAETGYKDGQVLFIDCSVDGIDIRATSNYASGMIGTT